MTSRIEYNNPESSGSLGVSYHYEMLSDARRLGPFKAAIERVCRNRVVLESGTGSGILSMLAARAGARHVYAVDIDPRAVELARRNVARAGLDNVEVLHADCRRLELGDIHHSRAEVIIAENLSTWQVTEPQVQIMNHLNRAVAAPAAIRLPARVDNQLALVHATYTFEDLVELRTHFFEFTGVPRAQTMSESITLERLDLRRSDNPVSIRGSVVVEAQRSGLVNALRLTSPLVVHDDIDFDSSDSLMPPVVVPLARSVEVDAGDLVRVEVEHERNGQWDGFHCTAQLAGDWYAQQP